MIYPLLKLHPINGTCFSHTGVYLQAHLKRLEASSQLKYNHKDWIMIILGLGLTMSAAPSYDYKCIYLNT